MSDDFASVRASYARRLMYGDMTRSQYNHAILMLERAEQRARDREAREARKMENQLRAQAKRKLKRQLMRSLAVSAALAFAVIPSPARAQTRDNTVQNLYTACAENDRDDRYADHYWAAWCLGYVRGVVDGHDVYAIAQNQNGCGDGSMSAEQIRRIFMRWADANPQYWNSPAPTGVAAAIYDAGMCG